jgi:YfiH family protein
MAQVADCVPVILYEPERHVGAVIHSGWRGTAQAITVKVLQSLIANHGASAGHVCAVIGPSIGGCCYEVSDEVAAAVAETVPGVPKAAFSVMQENGKPRIDLQQVIRHQLEAMGVAQLEVIGACTLCESNYLWSHRRGELGRQVGFLQLLPI